MAVQRCHLISFEFNRWFCWDLVCLVGTSQTSLPQITTSRSSAAYPATISTYFFLIFIFFQMAEDLKGSLEILCT